MSSFLSFNNFKKRLPVTVTADDDEFDEEFLDHLREEGFDVTYLPFDPTNSQPTTTHRTHLASDLELGETHAIIAFAQAATTCLSLALKPQPKLCALICYYPHTLPSPKASYPSQLEVLVHLAGDQPFAPASVKSYRYEHALVGFAEHDLETYDGVAAKLAWSRTVGVLRRGFKKEVDLEGTREKYANQLFSAKSAEGVAGMMVQDSYLNCVPTMTGGIGQRDLFIFYRDYFIPKSPPSLSIKLVSRTIGTDQVVDEMVLSFKHTQEVPWLLPGVKATNKAVHIAVVSIVALRGAGLVHEHLYWDQASVLVQVGLLDPKLVPKPFQSQGLKRLPVSGSEAAAKVLDEESRPSNELIPDWKQSMSKQGGQALPQRPKQAVNGGKGAPSS
ncbi:Dienelactone hydrolase [Cercospora zeina]